MDPRHQFVTPFILWLGTIALQWLVAKSLGMELFELLAAQALFIAYQNMVQLNWTKPTDTPTER